MRTRARARHRGRERAAANSYALERTKKATILVRRFMEVTQRTCVRRVYGSYPFVCRSQAALLALVRTVASVCARESLVPNLESTPCDRGFLALSKRSKDSVRTRRCLTAEWS